MKVITLFSLLLISPLQAQDRPVVRNKFSKVIGWKNLAPKVPKNFIINRLAVDLKNPRWTYEAPNGDIFIAESKAGQITVVRDADKNGSYEKREIFLKNLHNPFGMLVYDKWFYVATEDALLRFQYSGELKSESKEEKVIALPDGGHHWTRNILFNSNNNKMYIAVGSSSNNAENGINKEKNRAAIWEINPDGTGFRIFSSGLRNPVGMDIHPYTKKMWTVVNERDNLGDDLVPDFLTQIKNNGFYGWPYSYKGNKLDERVKNPDMDLVKQAIVPDIDLGAHTASLGLAFYTQKSFPNHYHDGAFIGQHGSWNSSKFTGYKVAFVPFVNGSPSGTPEDFMVGFIADEKKNEVYGRPVGVTVLKDGSLIVADDGGNIVWRITYGPVK